MIRSSLAFGALLAVAGSAVAADSYTLDPSHSYGNFKIGHMGLSTMHGRIDVTEGTLVIDREGDGSKVDVTLDPASVDTGHEERDEHLRDKEGFFEVDKYPKMRFVSTSVQFDDDDSSEATVKGDLTLHGVTREVALEVEGNPKPIKDPWGKMRLGGVARTTIQRDQFGIGSQKLMEGGGLVMGNDVDVTIDVELTQK